VKGLPAEDVGTHAHALGVPLHHLAEIQQLLLALFGFDWAQRVAELRCARAWRTSAGCACSTVRARWTGDGFGRNLVQLRSVGVLPGRIVAVAFRHGTGGPRILEGVDMRLRYVGKTAESDKGQCEALYATDRGTFVVQGKIVTDRQAIADLRDLGADESYVEVPADVLRLVERA
jgi:hypothetical protein